MTAHGQGVHKEDDKEHVKFEMQWPDATVELESAPGSEFSLRRDFNGHAGSTLLPFASLRTFRRGLIVRPCTRIEKMTTP